MILREYSVCYNNNNNNNNDNNNNGLLKYTWWHKNYELQCKLQLKIKLHLFQRDWDYRLFISY